METTNHQQQQQQAAAGSKPPPVGSSIASSFLSDGDSQRLLEALQQDRDYKDQQLKLEQRAKEVRIALRSAESGV